MYKMFIKLNSINAVKEFVSTVNQYPYDVDLISGRYIVDAKSIMGIFSLDLTEPIEVKIHAGEASDLVKALDKFEKDS